MEMEMQVTNLVRALENATVMAKQLPSTTDSATIYASLHAAHRHLSHFLANTTQSPPQPQPSPSADVTDDVDEPMPIADEEEDSKMVTIEERMKDFSIQNNKRLKRSLSLTEGERMRWLEYETEAARARFDYGRYVNRLRALDLIYQFHS